ncbi:MAG: LdpA C-terminal domain-containing domain [Cyanobacteria bacterium P01_F01_bin.86]
MSIHHRSLKSLKEGRWFKLICGASYQHLPAIRNLALAYGLAGADCIDVAADPAVVEAVREAFQAISYIEQTEELALQSGCTLPTSLPLLMVSFSDGEDPHFRKAVFEATACPADCLRPCESICPASAIAFNDIFAGVIEDRCYGCGRCLPVCPAQHIDTITKATAIDAIAPQLLHQVDAIEIHTQVGRYDSFMALWAAIQPYITHLTLISISCPDHDDVINYLWQLYKGMQPLAIPLIWQTDGRPMSGDIGKGTTHTTIKFAKKVLQAGPPGFVQLAGGTNAHTVSKLHELTTIAGTCTTFPDIFGQKTGNSQPTFGGIAYGSYARHLVSPLLDKLPIFQSEPASAPETTLQANHNVQNNLEASPIYLAQAVQMAQSLVNPIKTSQSGHSVPSLQTAGGRLPAPVENPSSRCYSSLFE